MKGTMKAFAEDDEYIIYLDNNGKTHIEKKGNKLNNGGNNES